MSIILKLDIVIRWTCPRELFIIAENVDSGIVLTAVAQTFHNSQTKLSLWNRCISHYSSNIDSCTPFWLDLIQEWLGWIGNKHFSNPHNVHIHFFFLLMFIVSFFFATSHSHVPSQGHSKVVPNGHNKKLSPLGHFRVTTIGYTDTFSPETHSGARTAGPVQELPLRPACKNLTLTLDCTFPLIRQR